ncbi:ABC-type transport system ATP-binding protein (probable substrate zinc) [Natronomonas moolapensis 8.8.11]|uniref:Cobalamin import ATP-binding protein BtuD n=1 Tax=Natronomonas moolapensis (strain DSM 18674 / CECT 7526 / JCM 14361 / 8.8.11) TaxID=268739 RepID=M1XL29_NATM8|nr:metal ABC transporter ATP-binding protein [Natronomonas moolapensis]CCQ36970.1 ABC-type transport system ATP-binding protein (probable substrate zinc) [Natronomonas moolapensis 8.8.11]
MGLIEVRDVSFAYADRPVIDGVSLTVEAGDFLGLVGPNGSGKTTLLELMIGLREPDRGSVSLFGESAHASSERDRIGFVPQNAGNSGGEMPVTVREVVRMGRYPRKLVGRLGDTDRRAVADAMRRVDITDLAERRVGRLSGGQRQRVFIARALAAEADLLALDEPTVGVDAESREAFYTLLGELNDEGITIILIEHDIGVVTTHASEIACLNRELYFHGDPETFVETNALADAYGGTQSVVHHDH